jgi:hypothetical protein
MGPDVNTDIFQLIKFVSKPLAYLRHENAHLACLGHHGECERNRNYPICVTASKRVKFVGKTDSSFYPQSLVLLALVL